MNKPIFNNRENPVHIIKKDTGLFDNLVTKEVWESRSIAVHGILIVRVNDEDYLLLTKRSDKCPDEIGKYANVTGYLDWDEDGINALKREYWEETTLWFDKYFNQGNLIYGDMDNPYSVKTDPKASRQNVTLRFALMFELDELPEVKETKETSEVKFVPISDIVEMIDEDKSQFAWDHATIIENLISDIYLELN